MRSKTILFTSVLAAVITYKKGTLAHVHTHKLVLVLILLYTHDLVHLQYKCSVHNDLTLDGFKKIFYMEYAHRMWGRLTGLAIILPAAYFWVRGRLGASLKPRVGVYIGLVVIQVMTSNAV